MLVNIFPICPLNFSIFRNRFLRVIKNFHLEMSSEMTVDWKIFFKDSGCLQFENVFLVKFKEKNSCWQYERITASSGKYSGIKVRAEMWSTDILITLRLAN